MEMHAYCSTCKKTFTLEGRVLGKLIAAGLVALLSAIMGKKVKDNPASSPQTSTPPPRGRNLWRGMGGLTRARTPIGLTTEENRSLGRSVGEKIDRGPEP